jgi:hypothetical protein
MTQPGERVTHGRHCICSACAAQDWAEPGLAACGMHGPSCPPVYAPIGPAGQRIGGAVIATPRVQQVQALRALNLALRDPFYTTEEERA